MRITGIRGPRARVALLAAIAALTVGALAGCTTDRAADSSAGGSSAGGSSAGGAAAAASASGAGAKTTGSQADRSIVTTGSLLLTAKDPIRAADRIDAAVTGAGGRLADRADQPGRRATSRLIARIPSAAFDATLRVLERQGRVTSSSVRSTDATDQVRDTAVRIAGLRASVARLQTLLGRASTTTDLVAIEDALTTRQTDLEQLLTQQKSLADQVTYATLSVSIVTPATVPVPSAPTFVSGFAGGLAGLLATLSAIVMTVGVLLPWAVVLALLTVAGYGVRRLVLRARARRRVAT